MEYGIATVMNKRLNLWDKDVKEDLNRLQAPLPRREWKLQGLENNH